MGFTKDSPITDIKGIGSRFKTIYNSLGIFNVRDLLFYIPYKFQDTSEIISIEEFKDRGKGTFLATIEDVKTTYFRKKITTVKVKDETDTVRLTFFNQPYLTKVLKIDDIYLFHAQITEKGGKRNIYNPKFEIFKFDKTKQNKLGKWTPIYSERTGLKSFNISKHINEVKADICTIIQDPLTNEERNHLKLIELEKALTFLHYPEEESYINIAKERLSFDEMLNIAFKIEVSNARCLEKKGLRVKTDSKVLNKYIKSLPYKLTSDQNKSVEEIISDMNFRKPMNRLLNGDVGSGKTVVASIAILNTIHNGYSCALLAPTTVLAQQHFNTFTKLFNNEDIKIEFCISKRKKLSSEGNKLIIGTHAILNEKILPKDLALVVIDEQHRFGVEQRNYIKKSGSISPHYLTMTATPIPRSLTEIFFGGLDVSELREKPKGRIDIKTYYTPISKRDSCFSWIKERIESSKKQEQAFIIYPLIEESEALTYKSIKNEYENLKHIFKGLKIEYMHGRLKEDEKVSILERFQNKNIDILVSTTVIEVGIDIPDATIMVVEDADHFGLAQLHQLRGRIGRSNKESFCFLIPSEDIKSDGKERLEYFAGHSSGFDVAQYDLERRGPGEVYGIKQSGIPQFKVASIYDKELLLKARKFAKRIVREDNSRVKYILENIFK